MMSLISEPWGTFMVSLFFVVLSVQAGLACGNIDAQ